MATTLLWILLVLLLLFAPQAEGNHCRKYFYSFEVLVSSYEDLSCSKKDNRQIAKMVEKAMDKELDNMGFLEYQNDVCRKAFQQRRLLSANNHSDPVTQMVLMNETSVDSNHRKLYGFTYVYYGRGRCSYCSHDNWDKRRYLKAPASNNQSIIELQNPHYQADRQLAQCKRKSKTVDLQLFRSGKKSHIKPQWRGTALRFDKDRGFEHHFLGRFFANDYVYRTYWLPHGTDEVTITFDFFEIDDWRGRRAEFTIDGHIIKTERLWAKKNEGIQVGYHKAGAITWSMHARTGPKRMGFGRAKDQIHRFIATFPTKRNKVFLKLRPRPPSGASAGFQHVRVFASTTCRASLKPGTSNSFAKFKAEAERRMEARVLIRSYQYFFKKKGHCWYRKIPYVQINLIEEDSWRDARPPARC